MGPSQPDFLCVLSADNGDLSVNKQEAEGRWGAAEGGPGPSGGGRGGGALPGDQTVILKQPETVLRPSCSLAGDAGAQLGPVCDRGHGWRTGPSQGRRSTKLVGPH